MILSSVLSAVVCSKLSWLPLLSYLTAPTGLARLHTAHKATGRIAVSTERKQGKCQTNQTPGGIYVGGGFLLLQWGKKKTISSQCV